VCRDVRCCANAVPSLPLPPILARTWGSAPAGEIWADVLGEHLRLTKPAPAAAAAAPAAAAADNDDTAVVVIIGGSHYQPKGNDACRLGPRVHVGHMLATYALQALVATNTAAAATATAGAGAMAQAEADVEGHEEEEEEHETPAAAAVAAAAVAAAAAAAGVNLTGFDIPHPTLKSAIQEAIISTRITFPAVGVLGLRVYLCVRGGRGCAIDRHSLLSALCSNRFNLYTHMPPLLLPTHHNAT